MKTITQLLIYKTALFWLLPKDYDDGLNSRAIRVIIIGGIGFSFSVGFLAGKASKKYRKVYYDGKF